MERDRGEKELKYAAQYMMISYHLRVGGGEVRGVDEKVADF